MNIPYEDYIEILCCLIPGEPKRNYDDPLSVGHLKYMATKLKNDYPFWKDNQEDRLHRRLGFIQAGLIANGLATLDTIRGRARLDQFTD